MAPLTRWILSTDNAGINYQNSRRRELVMSSSKLARVPHWKLTHTSQEQTAIAIRILRLMI